MNGLMNDIEKERFSQFSSKVNDMLQDKLRNNPYIQQKAEELRNYNNIQKMFKKVKNIK